MKISQTGLELIKNFEGRRLDAYYDIAGILTIGYGSTGPHVRKGMRITEQEAEDLLLEDLKRFEEGVTDAVKVMITQNQFDALVSLSFNIGMGAFRSSTALKRLNRNNYTGCAEAMTWWNKATVDGQKREVAGLTRRREAEAVLFLKPSGDGDVINPNDGLVEAPGMAATDEWSLPDVSMGWLFDKAKEHADGWR